MRFADLNEPIIGLKKRIAEFSVYGMLVKVIPFLMLPYLSSTLSPAHFGLSSLFLVSILVLSQLLSLGSTQIILKEYLHSSPTRIAELIRTIQFLSISISVFLLLVLLIPLLSNPDNIYLLLLYPAIITACIATTVEIQLKLYKIQGKVHHAGWLEFFLVCHIAFFTIIAFEGFDLELKGRVLAITAAYLAIGLYIFIYMFKKPKIKINYAKNIKLILTYANRNSLYLCTTYLRMIYDRILISLLIGQNDLGFYSAALTISSVVTTFNLAVSNAYTATILSNLQHSLEARRELLSQPRLFCWCVIIAGGVGFYPLSQLLFMLLIDDKLAIGMALLPYLIAGKVFEGLYLTTTKLFVVSNSIEVLGRINILNLLGYFILALFLSQLLGLVGVALAFLLSNMGLFLHTLLHVKRLEKSVYFINR